MTFQDVLAQAIDWLQRDKRITYRALQRQFDLDDDYLEDLKNELIEAKQVAKEENGRVLVWTGDAATPEVSARRWGESEGRFQAILRAVTPLLQSERRVTYRTLKYAFGIDDALMAEICKELRLRRLAIDEEGEVLCWTGDTPPIAPPADIYPNRHTTATVAHISPAPLTPQTQVATTDVATNGPPAPQPIRSAPEAERRQLTVMFCDLADSTELSQQLDPEDLRDIIRAYQRTSAEVIRHFDGYIAQHLGDGLLIYFGWPRAHEDDAPRALHAGLGIVEAITENLNPRLERDKGIQLAVRLGVHTGSVVIGEMGGGGRQEHLATGETVNIAARLESLAQPNTLVISQVTERLVRGAFACKDLGPQRLKGVADPIAVFRVLSPREIQRHEDENPPDGGVFLVGRDEEVGLLLRRWEQAKHGLGQAVHIIGEAGVGKSSLVAMIRQHAAQEGLTRITFRCSPYHTNSALYPVITQLEQRCGFDPDDTSDVKLAKLERLLHTTNLPPEESAPLFATLLSVPLEAWSSALTLSPQQQRQQTLDMLVAWFIEEAERQPVLAVWEDVHWADPSTLEMLGLMVDQSPTAAILNLLTFRPDFTPPWPTRSHLTPITLTRLERPQVEALIAHLAKDKILPAEVVEHIVMKTDGVPLYVEELVKMILASGLLREETDQYVLMGPLHTLAIPDTLQASLMARLDQMHMAKEVAQLGAVLGREFTYDMLQALSSQDDETVQASLAQLVEAELLHQRGRPPHARYIFKHALIQDAAYASLLKRTRQRHHRQIAGLLEAQFPDTVASAPELVAHHYSEAGFAEQAVMYWQQAGQRAIERSANAEAVSHLSRGLDMLMALPDTLDRARQELTLHITLGGPLIATQGYRSPNLVRSTIRARELVDQLGDAEQRFAVFYRQWVYHLTLPDAQHTRLLSEEFLHHAEREGDPALILMGHRLVGTSRFCLGHLQDARIHLEQALVRYDPQRHHDLTFRFAQNPEIACKVFLALALWLLGYPKQAVRLSNDALAMARAQGHLNTLAYALFYGGSLFAGFRREVKAVAKHARALVDLSREQGMALWLGLGTVFDGWARMLLGYGEQELSRLVKGLADVQTSGSGLPLTFMLTLLAEVYAEDGQPLEGLRILGEALTLVDTTAECLWEAEMYRLAGALLQRSEGREQWAEWTPEMCFHQALDVSRRQQAKSLELRAATSLARLWQSQSRRQEAHDLLAPVYHWFTEGLNTADLQDAKALLDELAEVSS